LKSWLGFRPGELHIKVKLHTSVELNERADRFAAEAPFVESNLCSRKIATSFNFIGKLRSAKELKEHFISL
jgi:hypothetical protein